MKWGGVFCKNWKMGVFLVKKWTFPQRRVHYVQYQYFLFYIYLFGGVYAPNAPPLPTGLAYCDLTVHRRAKCFSVVRLVYRERVA